MKKSFGFNKEGKEVSLYTLENEKIRMSVMDYGATLVSFVDKETGIDLVEGFDCVEDYMKQDTYIGASIGRTANRIKDGTFSLNGKTYHCPVNNGPNCNHGGMEGFDKKLWHAVEEEDSVTFRYTSIDGEEGYPGNLFVKVVYQLKENGISIVSEGRSDQDTLFAYTNHSYFNLDESENAMDHGLKIYGDQYALSDQDGLTLDEVVSVKNTPFDFTEWKLVGKDINEDNQQLRFGAGYDHHYPIKGQGLRDMAILKGKKVTLTMRSDFPWFHLYTANWLPGWKGKRGHNYPKRSAVCLEAEYMPNAINYPDQVQPVVHAGEILKHEIQFLISHEK